MFKDGCRLAVYGDDDFTESIIEQIKTIGLYIISFIVSNEMRHLHGLDCYTVEELRNKTDEFDCILIVEQMPLKNDKLFNLYKNGFCDCYVLNKESPLYFDAEGRINHAAIQHFRLDKRPVLRYLETHIVDSCNLNCKGCTHFANINDDAGFVDIYSFEKQLSRLSELCDISIFRLMGGEPFLHPNLIEVFNISRFYFPNTLLFIVSNGLLLDSLSEDICKSLIDNRIIVNISPYLPTIKKREKIETHLDKYGIEYYWGNGEKTFNSSCTINLFHTCLSPVTQENSGYSNCYNKYCWFLRNGFISKCAYPQLIYLLNETFNAGFKVNQEDLVDIFLTTDGWSIIKRLNTPMSFCSYCSSSLREFNWSSGGTPSVSDYFI